MKSLVWNARGLGSGRAFRTLLKLKQNHSPDFMFLVEMKVTHSVLETMRVKLGFFGKLVVDCVGRSGGLCLFWTNFLKVDLLSFSRFHIDVQVNSHGGKIWRLTGFYGHPVASERFHSWTLLRRLHGMYSLPWFCVGDFNEILNDSEKVGGQSRSSTLMDNFRSALDDCGLEDLGFLGPPFTWCNKRDTDQLVQERLDRGVCNFQWRQLFHGSCIHHLEYWRSDHRPLLIEVMCRPGSILSRDSRQRRRFHFEACWADNKECHLLVEKCWCNFSGCCDMNDIVSKIRRCSDKLAGWNSNNRTGLRKDIKAKQHELCNATSNIQQGSWRVIRTIERQLDELLEEEEAYRKQRSRVEWLREGDRNTRFFHWKASARKGRNKINGLRDNNGMWQTDFQNMVNVITDYFGKMFSSSSPSSAQIDKVTASVEQQLSTRNSLFLDRAFSAEEIKKAIFDMSPTKAPGLDGLPALFYQKFWDKIGGDVTRACLRCLNDGEPFESVNGTLITLLLKIQHAEGVQDFRPISLCNVLYKIMAKTLANRFRVVLGEVISENQSEFIPSRLITDNVIIGFECIHALRNKKRKVGSMALKLDMSKAYDRVERDFLSRMMSRLGFSNSWIDRVMRCVRSVSFSFLLNGKSVGLLCLLEV
ncbi:hypothetical protein Dsin_002302 [Dipteronia sinensis]|uniref:Reverse transcriptase n=1 Tax=Dipteronia sinensis TaxID=43782 RepID=A0AAE0EJ97_9ROSI|nr:hypothetical protein Dsin_002302 [Dipteronia sinensis]